MVKRTRKEAVSRPTAQRLVSAAVSEGLVKVRLDHPIAHCMELGKAICERYELAACDVVPTDPAAPEAMFGMAQAAATYLERALQSPDPQIIALGTGRAMRAMVDEVGRIDGRHHKIVSLVGTIAHDGAASFYDAVIDLADRTRAPHYPLPIPVIIEDPQMRQRMQQQPPMDNILKLAAEADIRFIGVGHLGDDAPLHIDGFISKDELMSLRKSGGIGEVISWSFDQDGTILDHAVNHCVTSAPAQSPTTNTIAVAKGTKKVKAIRGAMRGKLISTLITDEATAESLLQ